MITGNEPAMPHPLHDGRSGMSIRQQIAVTQMAAIRNGLIICTADGSYHGWSDEAVAKQAVLDADVLIAELNKATQNAILSTEKTPEA